MEILQIENLSFTYPDEMYPVLDSVNITLEKGEFAVLAGASGSGKSTLLRLIKSQLAPSGTKSGNVLFCNKRADMAVAGDIGMVMQDPDLQIVTDAVWQELAFGLENMGCDRPQMHRRIAEVCSCLGISDLYNRKCDSLSGGQKQILNLASVIAMRPKLLLLDEPTSQLDPVAASTFMDMLKKLNRQLGLTVLMAEHRLEDCFYFADQAIVLEKGKILCKGAPEQVCRSLKGHTMFSGMPASARIWSAVADSGPCPLTVRQGRDFMDRRYPGVYADSVPDKATGADRDAALEADGIWFRYTKDGPDILKDFSLRAASGEIVCILGANGSGKSTAVSVLSGLCRPYRGKCRILGKKIGEYKSASLYRNTVAVLPQNPGSLFIKNSVQEDFRDVIKTVGADHGTGEADIERIVKLMGIGAFISRHPGDLSGGEKQKCAIAKLLLAKPRVIFLDEPTKGIDSYARRELVEILRRLRDEGKCVICVSHDAEFAAECADRCMLIFDGRPVCSGTPQEFFSENGFYTTGASLIAREHFPLAVTCEQVVAECRKAEM